MSAVLDLDPGFILAEAARLTREADPIKDKTYQQTPIGRLAKLYLDGLVFDNYSGKTAGIREPYLAKLAIQYADKTLSEISYNDLRAFSSQWTHASANTRRSVVSTLRVFFDWAYEFDHIDANPAKKLKTPRTKDEDSRKRAFALETVRLLITSQPQRRDRLSLQVLYWLALRKDELRQVRVRDFDFQNNLLTVHGKGGTVLEQNVRASLAGDLETYFRDIGAAPSWCLLSPQKQVRYGTYPLYRYELKTLEPEKSYTESGMQRWFEGCRDRAGLDDITLHELRHTSGTHFHMEGHDLVATQHHLRHKNPATTAQTYVHLDRVRAVADVQSRMRDPLKEDVDDV